MKPVDVGLAIMVAVIWGLAFVASRFALNEFSPALMTALRFAGAALPCLFVRKPDISWPLLIAISGTLFLGQFLAQAYGIAHGVPVGLTSVIVQSQALFTIAFAVVAFREMPTPMQTVGIGVATIGLLMICGTVGYDFSAGAFALLVPFVGAAASSIVFGERFGPLRLSGMVIVVCGIAVMLMSKRPQVLPEIA